MPVAFGPDAPARAEPIDLPAIAVPAVPADGPVAVTVGLALAMDSV